MLQSIQDKSVQFLETVVERLEQFEQLQKRPRVFAKSNDGQSDEVHAQQESNNGSAKVNGVHQDDVHIGTTEKLK